jgi:hypothetical protein
MSTTRPFAYNPGSPITGTEQVGDLAVGYPTSGFTGTEWWNGPDEELGYVIAQPVSGDTQPTNVPEDALILSSTYNGGDIVLSNNNQTAEQIFGYQKSVLGETIISGTDKVMFSVLCNLLEPNVLIGSHFIGVGTTSMNYQGNPYGGYPGNDVYSIGFSDDGKYYYNGSVVTSGLPTWTDGDIIDIVISHGQYWWIRVNGGDWNNNPSADPSTLANGLTMNGLTNYYPALCPSYQGIMTVLNYPKYGVPSEYNFLGNVRASVGFFRTDGFDDNEFIDIANIILNSNYTNAPDASAALTTNGYWNSYLAPVLSLDAGNPSSYPGSGNTWTDTIGGKTFNLINNPTYSSSNGGRIQFIPSSYQFAECSSSLPDLNTWSVGVWHFYTGQNTGGSPCIVTEKYTGGYINYIVGNGSDTSPDLQTGFWAPGWILTENGYTLTPNNWYYIVGTYDGNTLRLYVNNTLVESTSGLVYTTQSSNSGIYLMSRWDNTPSELWGGYLSIVNIYDKALDQSQVTSYWNSTKSRFGL